MKKKITFVCALLVMLALITTSCRLPASGSPPATSTQAVAGGTTPGATKGGGVSAEPTSTSISPQPTPVVVTATPLPPTPVPPTPAPPTATPLPSASRIQFAAGGTTASVDGEVDSGQTLYYVLQAGATQTMNVSLWSPNGDVYLGIAGANGQVLLDGALHDANWVGTLPTTQDYYLSLTPGNGRTSYSLSVEIPQLPTGGPTSTAAPVAGTFDPVAAYGLPDMNDPMNGGNLSAWTNPTTLLLPNTDFIRIVETDARFYVTGKLTGFSTWYFSWPELTDFYLQSTFDSGSCSGKDSYGLIVRGPEHLAGVSYGYVVAFSCDGQYWIYRLDGANPFTEVDLVSWTHSDYILTGPNAHNVMGIQAIGDTLTIYANGHQIAQVVDSRYDFGRYGVFVWPDVTPNYTYRVIQMSYWDLTP
jgi:hypothetical protein